MPRRRYRLFAVLAAVTLFMLYRVAQNTWDDSEGLLQYKKPPLPQKPLAQEPKPISHQDSQDDGPRIPAPMPPAKAAGTSDAMKEDSKTPASDAQETLDKVDEKKPLPNTSSKGKTTVDWTEPNDMEQEDSISKHPSAASAGEKEDQASLVDPEGTEVEADTSIHYKAPPKDNVAGSNKGLTTTNKVKTIHWEKQPEHFPVSDEDAISLPFGKPKRLPKIQFDFEPESSAAREIRLQRQSKVKSELKAAWTGYRKFAWMHDELSPVSGRYADPFCGWAATLVDSLDTLWIAGMKDEFEEAVKAVKDIDFTTTSRGQIPVFETTIRYLGGLIAAFDVSGGFTGQYSLLLDKAIELAEILMGIFDTPNRMPVLYYNWKPEYASQPHRAGTVGIAELGTLSLEFTRLAQLTGKQKYYDAVARITNALVDLQAEGTDIPGLFPESLDASGCNRTATKLRDEMSAKAQAQMDSETLATEPQGWESEYEQRKTSLQSDRHKDALSYLGRGESAGADTDDDVLGATEDTTKLQSGSTLRGEQADGSRASSIAKRNPVPAPRPPFTAKGDTAEWECVPQGLAPPAWGGHSYHMAGGQDSAYEYFPKEYILLGGLEDQYKKLHIDTVKAVNENLLYRPMGADGWDVLFPAKVSVSGHAAPTHTTYEVTHLTCFIGGMYALGGKIFEREEDVETAKKLTDGCVWAYSVTPTGLMPEAANVLPCPTLEDCEFNMTAWYDALDSSKEWRKERIAEWEKMQKVEADTEDAADDEKHASTPGTRDDDVISDRHTFARRAAVPKPDGEAGSALPDSLKKKLGMETQEEGSAAKSSSSKDEDTSSGSSAKSSSSSSTSTARKPGFRDTQKPLSHEEYVEEKIEKMKLPKGFTLIRASPYILRPEAIESVWYMYRITGDPSWQDKGWKMFEATIAATKSQWAHSAIGNVMEEEPRLEDSMESFWIAETLKYYYLLFSEPDLISLDEWVLNTEAHPFKRPVSS